ncbi:hypothetical protein NMG60_11003218 [Bertholletia excelsa]
MGRQSIEPAMVGSSIALLQERFRQLQRVREKREEQELLKLFSESEHVRPTKSFKPGNLSLHTQMIFPLSSPSGDALSLRLTSPSKSADSRAIKAGQLKDFKSPGSTIISISPNNENSEVDTSLHL